MELEIKCSGNYGEECGLTHRLKVTERPDVGENQKASQLRHEGDAIREIYVQHDPSIIREVMPFQ